MLLYAQHHWPKAITANLWGFTLKFTSILKQHSIRHKRKHSPMQLFSGTLDVREAALFTVLTQTCKLVIHHLTNGWTDLGLGSI